MLTLLLKLFLTFFIIGLFNFGGGGAMISLIQNQVVEVNNWLSEAAFTDITAISQVTPGPIGINCATYVGYQVMYDAGYGSLAGVIGSAATTLAIVLPSFIIFYLLMKLFERFHKDPRFISVMDKLKPAVSGLIFAACIILTFHISWNGWLPQVEVIKDNFPDWKSWLLFAGAFSASYFFNANPIYIILAAGVLGLIIY
ncbi:MAG: chromate transporter [Candidatus Cryptobacteroides sp.]